LSSARNWPKKSGKKTWRRRSWIWSPESTGWALLGFDVYTKRREKIYEIKADEAKRRVSGLMRKTGLSEDSL